MKANFYVTKGLMDEATLKKMFEMALTICDKDKIEKIKLLLSSLDIFDENGFITKVLSEYSSKSPTAVYKDIKKGVKPFKLGEVEFSQSLLSKFNSLNEPKSVYIVMWGSPFNLDKFLDELLELDCAIIFSNTTPDNALSTYLDEKGLMFAEF